MAAEVIDATVTATTDVVAEVKSDDAKSGKKAKPSTKEKKPPRSRAPLTHPPYLEVSVFHRSSTDDQFTVCCHLFNSFCVV